MTHAFVHIIALLRYICLKIRRSAYVNFIENLFEIFVLFLWTNVLFCDIIVPEVIKMSDRIYLCIDLKSFYASVECVERRLDPMKTNLIVADPSRGSGTVCLAVTPSMKALGVRNRCRVFEIPPDIEYITAPPRMQLYINYSAMIYSVYLEFISKDDIHVYSVDEAFLDVTSYLTLYGMTAYDLGRKIMDTILQKTGIRAACGIGTNLYLAKIALDITAKHSPDFIGYLDEAEYRRTLWKHTPLTDFWRIGKGTAQRLERYGITTMQSIAEANEELLYKLFGIDAELLIDHAWGRESTTIADIKKYRPKTNSLSSGQVLPRDYSFDEGKIILKEMMDSLCLDLTDKNLVTNSISLYVGYSNGLKIPGVHGSLSLGNETNSDRVMLPAIEQLFSQITDHSLPIRRFNISCNHICSEEFRQFSFLEDPEDDERSRNIRKAVIGVKKKYGKNAVLRGMNFQESATARERNCQIGGHRSGE